MNFKNQLQFCPFQLPTFKLLSILFVGPFLTICHSHEMGGSEWHDWSSDIDFANHIYFEVAKRTEELIPNFSAPVKWEGGSTGRRPFLSLNTCFLPDKVLLCVISAQLSTFRDDIQYL